MSGKMSCHVLLVSCPTRQFKLRVNLEWFTRSFFHAEQYYDELQRWGNACREDREQVDARIALDPEHGNGS